MPTPERLAEQFEEHRSHVRGVACGGNVVDMDILPDPDRLRRLDLSAMEP